MTENVTPTFLLSPDAWLQEVHATAERLALYLSNITELSEQDITALPLERDIAQILDALSLTITVFAQYTQNEMLLTIASSLRRLSAQSCTAHYNLVRHAQNTLLGTESQT